MEVIFLFVYIFHGDEFRIFHPCLFFGEEVFALEKMEEKTRAIETMLLKPCYRYCWR